MIWTNSIAPPESRVVPPRAHPLASTFFNQTVDNAMQRAVVFNQKVEQGGTGGCGPALPGVLGARRPHPAKPGGTARRRRRHAHPARRVVRGERPGRRQAPQGARGRGPRDAHPTGAAATGAPRGGGVRPHDEVDRALPPPGRGALPAARRRPARPAGRRRPAHTRARRSRTRQGIRTRRGRGIAMTATGTHETTITADPNVPLIRITREFDAPPAKVFRAHTDPELYAQW